MPDVDALIDELREEDDYGLCGWIFTGNGQGQQPFADMKQRYPDAWNRIAAELY
jgi:hypothetical protein